MISENQGESFPLESICYDLANKRGIQLTEKNSSNPEKLIFFEKYFCDFIKHTQKIHFNNSLSYSKMMLTGENDDFRFKYLGMYPTNRENPNEMLLASNSEISYLIKVKEGNFVNHIQIIPTRLQSNIHLLNNNIDYMNLEYPSFQYNPFSSGSLDLPDEIDYRSLKEALDFYLGNKRNSENVPAVSGFNVMEM